jgi:hypothetical protein
VTHEHYAYVTADWARKWPAEEIWAATKKAGVGSTEPQEE